MKKSMCATIILVAAVSLAGCSMPCFHQAGTSMQQCERDLLQCIDQARVLQKSQAAKQVRSCMQAKGYELVDEGKFAPGARRITVMASFETYWVLDGLDAAPTRPAVVAQQPQAQPEPQVQQSQPQPRAEPPPQVQTQARPQAQNVTEAPQAKPVGYRARLDENGRPVLIPVYEHEQTGSAQSSSGGQ